MKNRILNLDSNKNYMQFEIMKTTIFNLVSLSNKGNLNLEKDEKNEE
ncbi:hypothetical protein HYW74_01790 [Candidatus Pacearchaeota archaeon]|nr:hypothetical protein [Candidatus Pacearchaeota archaeon]